MINVNTEYELRIKKIYQLISALNGVQHIDVQHNVNIKGKSGCTHQIDVYWKFCLMDVEHQVAIECKNYSSPVSIGKIRDFNSVLQDIGNITGVFVTKTGYQSGAIKYAANQNIKLMEFRQPNDSDWDGRIKDISVTINISSSEIKNRNIVVNAEWISENINTTPVNGFTLCRNNNEIKIIDKNSNELTNFHELDNSLPLHVSNETLFHTYTFDDAFIKSNDGELLKISKIEYKYNVITHEEKFIIEGDNIAKSILKNITTGDGYLLNKDDLIKEFHGSE